MNNKDVELDFNKLMKSIDEMVVSKMKEQGYSDEEIGMLKEELINSKEENA